MKTHHYTTTFLVLLLTACGGDDGGTTAETPETPAPPAVPKTITFDCTTSNCPEQSVAGDSYATLPNSQPSSFRGFADASLRQDPVSGRLWMAYSWPTIHVVGAQQTQVPSVDVHLAYSDDGGDTWVFDSALWPSQASTDLGGTGEMGYTGYEVANILPVETASGVVWYGVRLEYFAPNNGGYSRRPSNSFRLGISVASSPSALATAPEAELGGALTSAAWASVDLSTTSPEVNKCQWWNEPALHYDNNTLYLVARCMAFNGQSPDLSEFDQVVFSTDAQGAVSNWSWQFVGILTDGADAVALGGAGLTEVDIVTGDDGSLLMVVTPDEWDPATESLSTSAASLSSS